MGLFVMSAAYGTTAGVYTGYNLATRQSISVGRPSLVKCVPPLVWGEKELSHGKPNSERFAVACAHATGDDYAIVNKQGGVISEIEIGLGPCGELRYPSYAARNGWAYPGIGEFQCYDQYLLNRLSQAAKEWGDPSAARVPDAGSYNSKPNDTQFFCDGGEYNGFYGRFFLDWYSKELTNHGDRVLGLAREIFGRTPIAAKVAGVHWHYRADSHAAELTAGYYNHSYHEGYPAIVSMLKRHGATLNFTCVELRTIAQQEAFPEANADPERLVWQVLNAAWDAGIPVASENALPCYGRDGYNKILEIARPRGHPDGKHHLPCFTYLRLTPVLLEEPNRMEFELFVKKMHGD